MFLNLKSVCGAYLKQNMTDKKISQLIYNRLKSDSHVVSFEDLECELDYTYRHSLHSTRGNLIEHVINYYIKSDKRFVLESESSKYVEFYIPKVIDERIAEILNDFRNRKLNLRDKNTYDYLTSELFELSKNCKKVDMIHYSTQIDLLFRDKNSKKLYFYELKSRDNHDMKSDLGTLSSFLHIFTYLIMKYNIQELSNFSMGIVYILEDSTLVAKSLATGDNAAVSFPEFCENFYNQDVCTHILTEIRNSIATELLDKTQYFKKVVTVYTKDFKGKDFTKVQLMSKIDNYSYRK